MVIAIGEAVQAEINLMALKKSKEKRFVVYQKNSV